MTHPTAIQSQNHLSVANTLRVLLRRAEQGELDGFIYLASCCRGEDKIGLCGRYATDLNAAISSAKEGFNCLLGHKTCIERDTSKLPRRMRKESANDHTCDVANCATRHRVA